MGAVRDEIFSRVTRSMDVSFIREMLKATKGVEGLISFAGGLPSPESFPREILSKLFAEVVLKEGVDVLQYGNSEGDGVLKEQIRLFESESAVSDDELIITDGTTNAIYLFTRSVIDPGDVVFCEAPSFNGSLVAIEACQAEIRGVEMDEEGLKTADLERAVAEAQAAGKKVKFIYAIPEFQNPSGRTMSLRRRRELIDLARRRGVLILEDQPYRDLRFEGERLDSLWNLARAEFKDDWTVVIAKSFSKILGPGLRVGYACGHPDIIAPMVKWMQKVAVSADCVTQRAIARFIERGEMKGQISRICRLYLSRRNAMLEALKKYMPPSVRWTHPEGGMFFWLMLDGVDTDELFHRAAKERVAYIPGSKFYPRGMARHHEIRLNYSYAKEADITEGVRRLAGIISQL